MILRPVSSDDYQFLFEMLKERDSRINIDFTMPTFEQHVRFCQSNPYQVWNIIQNDLKRLGHVYLTHKNEIGIFVKKELKNKGIGSQVITEFLRQNPRKQYLANINPQNTISVDFFTKHGFKPKEIIFSL